MARTYQRRRAGVGAVPPRYRRGGEPRAPQNKRGNEDRRLRSRILRWVGIFATCCVVAVLAFIAGGYLGLVKAVENLNEVSATTSHPTYLYSKPVGESQGTTRVIGTIFHGENRRPASLEDMPPGLLDALVAKEDERFREHGGVDLWGITRALWIDIRAGEAVEGASTITQQYVKNAYLSGDRTLQRKLKEAAIAVEIERKYEKNEILGMYLNTVYFGSNAYGVEAAAETYFSKSAEDLTVGESATLIGLLWSPSTLGANRDEATNQRNLVLEKMFKAGYLTRQDLNEALDRSLPEPWPKSPMVETGLGGLPLTRDFAELVEEELVNQYGANTVLAGGLSVYTTLDLEAQVTAQELLYKPGGFLSQPENPDAALVSIDPDSGRVMAMVGDRDEESRFNIVTHARRQPGSSFKPFALIAALEQGVDPSTRFVSEKKRYVIQDAEGGSEEWEVENYENKEHGEISLETALWLSDNAVFTDLVLNVDGRGLENGPEAVADVANRLGISTSSGFHPSIVLGTQEVSPLEMATAYATIANEGRKVTPTGIEKVVLNEGQEDEEILYTASEEGTEEGEQVINRDVARKATEIMVGDVTQGIAWKASLGDQPVAGKTGTSENFFDAWFLGFTPQMVTGVWMGYADGGATLEGLLNIGGQQLGPLAPPPVIWQSYMTRVLKDEPVEKFEGINVPQTTEEAAKKPNPPDPSGSANNNTASPDVTGPGIVPPGIGTIPGPPYPTPDTSMEPPVAPLVYPAG